jgi:CheY-like chemotaxis protein
METRIGTTADIPGILALQAQNLLANLAADQRADGFVTTPFTPEILTELLAQRGVFVAVQEDQIIAYILAGSWDFFSRWPIFLYMVSLLPSWQFQGQPLSASKTFQYGPVCVDKKYRGQQVLPQLFEIMRFSFADRYSVGVTFINQLNPRSYAAHTQKLQWQVVAEFEFNQGKFYGLAHDLKPV